jgi:transcriptional regulator with XRE-family HTH domain
MLREFNDDRFFEALRVGPDFEHVGAGTQAPTMEDAREVSLAFGPFLTTLRSMKGVSRSELAARTNIAAERLMWMEHDPVVMTDISEVASLAQFFEIPEGALRELAGLSPPSASVKQFAHHLLFDIGDKPAPVSPHEQLALTSLVAMLR